MKTEDKERIEKENEWIKNAWEVWEEDQKHHTQPVNPHAYVHGFVAACKVIEKQLKQERNKAIDDFKQRLKSRIITWNASTQEEVPSYSYRDIFKLIDNL